MVRLGADCNLAVCSELGVTPDGESRRGRGDSRCARLTEPVSSSVPRRYNELTAAPVPECHRRQHFGLIWDENGNLKNPHDLPLEELGRQEEVYWSQKSFARTGNDSELVRLGI